MASILPQTAFRAIRAAAPLPRAVVRPSLKTQLPRAQPVFRRFINIPQEQPRLRLGATGMREQTI